MRAVTAALTAALMALLTACAAPPSANPSTPVPLDVLSTPALEATPATEASTLPAAEVLAEPVQLPPWLDTPRGRFDPLQDAERSDLWARLRQGFVLPDLQGSLVQKWEQWYASRPDYVQRMSERGGRYLFHIIEEIERRGMPGDLALLPFIESAFNPQAQSRASASGMWQFMPATGKDFELRQNLFRDDRRDVLASTRAALDYLQRLHGMFGDWHLALAAYNWGQGNVSKAIAANRRAGLGTGYEDLRMPDETRNYVPKLQAVKNLIARPDAYGVVLPLLENHPHFLSVLIERDIDVKVAARLSGLSLEDFSELNPQMNKPVILAAGTPQVLLPYDNANRFLRELALHTGPLATWTAWVAPKTVRPAEAARLVGMPEAQLREVNRIPARMLVKAGSTLLVRRAAHGTHDVAEHIADNASMVLSPESQPLRKISFKVGRQGDSVAAVAKRYKVKPAQVATWNGVGAQARFKPGQAVVVMVPPQKATRRAPNSRAPRRR